MKQKTIKTAYVSSNLSDASLRTPDRRSFLLGSGLYLGGLVLIGCSSRQPILRLGLVESLCRPLDNGSGMGTPVARVSRGSMVDDVRTLEPPARPYRIAQVREATLVMDDGSYLSLDEYARVTECWGVPPAYQVPSFGFVITEARGDRIFLLDPTYYRSWGGVSMVGTRVFGVSPVPQESPDNPRYRLEVVFPDNPAERERQGGAVYRVTLNDSGQYVRDETGGPLFHVRSNLEVQADSQFWRFVNRSGNSPLIEVYGTSLYLPSFSGAGTVHSQAVVRGYYTSREDFERSEERGSDQE